MKINDILRNLNPADVVLETEYDSLTDNQKRFANYLIEERYYNVREAIKTASKVQKWDRFGDPRSKKIEYLRETQEGIGFNSFYRNIREYDSLTEEEQILVYNLVGDCGWTLEKALKLAKENFILVCKVQIPNGCELHEWSKEGEYWNTEALKEIGEAMMDRNYYPATFLEGYYRYRKSHYITKKYYLELMRLHSGWYLDTEQIARSAIQEASIEYFTNPDDEYNYQYVFLNKFNFWHNMPDWEWVGDEREEYRKKKIVYDEMKIRESKRWLDAMAAVKD